MKYRKRSLSTLSAIAVTFGLAACAGESRQSQANAPTQPMAAAPPPNEYGAAMGQAPGTAPGQTEMPSPGSPYAATGQAPTGSTSGQPMAGTEYGGAQAPGAPAGANPPGTMGGMQGTTGAMGAPSGMAGGMTGQTGPSGAPSPAPSPSPGAPPVGGSTAGAIPGEAAPSAMDVSTLDDAQLAAIVLALNMAKIQAAQLAESKAGATEVKRYAHDMATEHRDMNKRANAVFVRIQIRPSDNAVSSQVKSDNENEMSTLQAEKGKDFDKDYIDAQIRDQNHALELIDRMTPNAKSPELKAELQNERMRLEAHLRQAERLQQLLQKGATSKQRERGGAAPSP
jgi:predicted outer membrane protein